MGTAAATVTKQPEEKRVKLRYLGSSSRLVDSTTKNVWEANGKEHTVSEDDAARLEALPYERFERVS